MSRHRVASRGGIRILRVFADNCVYLQKAKPTVRVVEHTGRFDFMMPGWKFL